MQMLQPQLHRPRTQLRTELKQRLRRRKLKISLGSSVIRNSKCLHRKSFSQTTDTSYQIICLVFPRDQRRLIRGLVATSSRLSITEGIKASKVTLQAAPKDPR
jgi:hypothetical protein